MDILKLNLNQAAPDRPSDKEIRFQVAFLAAVPALVSSFVARFVFGGPLVPELLAQFVFAIAPIWMVELGVGLLGPFAKHLAFLACTVLYLIVLMAVAFAYLRYRPATTTSAGRYALPLSFAMLIWSTTLAIFLPAIGAGILGVNLRQGAVVTSVWLFFNHCVYGLALLAATMRYIDRPASAEAPATVISRRRVMRFVGYGVLVVGIYDIGKSLFGSWLKSGSGRVKGGDGVFPNIQNLALELTPTADFYEVSKNAFDPLVDERTWRLEVAGLVEKPVTFTYEEIRAMASVEQYATLACISNEVGGDLIGNAQWRGVPLRDILQTAVLKPGVIDIVLHASDDYTDSIPLDRAMAEGTLLVVEMNGEQLRPEHGFPVRLLVPGIYGMKNVKWITRIEAVGVDIKGYWQRRGWDDRAEYKTMSRIDAPEGRVKSETSIAGIAFAGDRGVSKVEVSTDGGATWEQAEIKHAQSRNSWVLWHKRWSPAQPGKYRLVVRATDGGGQVQTSQYAPPAPSGSSGYHAKTVSVAES